MDDVLLRQFAGRAEELRAAKVAAFAAKFEKMFGRNIEKILAKIETFDRANPARGTAKALQIAAMLNEIQTELERSGFWDTQRESLTKLYGAELKNIQRVLEITAGKDTDAERLLYSGADKELVSQLIEYDYSKLTATASRYLGDIQAHIMREKILGQPVPRGESLGLMDGKLERNIDTELNTALHSFNRTVSAKKARDLFGDNPKYLYVGPLDSVTRDFCEQVLEERDPPIYTEEEIADMASWESYDGPGDPLTSGGGYNCRHDWYPVSDDYAAELEDEDNAD